MENYLTNCLKRADCVVIPAYEPADVLVDLTDKLAAMDFLVLIVDDGSSSKCQPVWRAVSSKAIVLHHDQNMGKGAALKTAFTYISEDLPDVRHIVTADADGQHLPDDIKKIMLVNSSSVSLSGFSKISLLMISLPISCSAPAKYIFATLLSSKP